MIRTIAAAALALAPTPALAQSDDDPLTARVAYGDLDLASADGIRTFDQRLKGAIRVVCPGRLAPDLQQRRRHRTCVSAAKRSIGEQRARILASATSPVRLVAVAR